MFATNNLLNNSDQLENENIRKKTVDIFSVHIFKPGNIKIQTRNNYMTEEERNLHCFLKYASNL